MINLFVVRRACINEAFTGLCTHPSISSTSKPQLCKSRSARHRALRYCRAYQQRSPRCSLFVLYCIFPHKRSSLRACSLHCYSPCQFLHHETYCSSNTCIRCVYDVSDLDVILHAVHCYIVIVIMLALY